MMLNNTKLKLKKVSLLTRFINFFIVSAAIQSAVPGANVVFNLVPKEFAMSDIYCQLIPNDDDNQPYYEVVPRIGSFEISINGVLLFSKCLSGCWPNPKGIA